MLNGRAWGNSIWTDFKDKWNGETYLGSYSTGAFMPDWVKTGGTSTVSEVISKPGSISGQAYRHAAARSTGSMNSVNWNELGVFTTQDVLIGGQGILHENAPTTAFGITIEHPSNGRIATEFTGGPAITPRNAVNITSIYLAVISSNDQSFNWSLNTWYWLRLNLDSGTIRVKYWQRGAPEPGWIVTWSPLVVGSGEPYMTLAAGALSEQAIDFFSVCSDGNPAWGPL